MASPIDGGCVVVTGASSGIGQAIAALLAHRAKKLVLVARRKDRLDALAAQLKQKNAALEVVTYGCDLADRAATAALSERLGSEVGPIDVLVNNAGVGDLGLFERCQLDKQLSMIDLNIVSLVQLTRAVLPGMVERGRGAILMVSSGFGLTYLPGFAGYIGTKHFVSGFTESLHTELAGTGVHVGQLCPGPVATEFEQHVGNFTGRKAPAITEISAERCAEAAIGVIDRRRALVVPHWLIKIAIWLGLRTPRTITRFFMRFAGRRVRREQLEAARP
ncbi:MAG: SDR family oxidoreductase [Polyangiaceae bacterium]|jgi:short-subunit dehydrogenase|nr:SDR family oxidoreductase [Polyangiaceae bacterium]MBK8936711.1 SDR family oxidoreductase [Polyangiaceae bacterium]